MKKIPFIINKKIIYIDHQFTKNKNAYLKLTKDNKILITSPINISDEQIVKFFSNKIKKLIKIIEKKTKNILYSLPEKFIFYNGKKLNLNFLTGFLSPKIEIKNDKFYIKSKKGLDSEHLFLIQNYLKIKMLEYVSKYQRLFEKKMNVPHHKIKVSYKFSNWATNNVNEKTIIYSSRLMHFNDDVRNYVIVHELAHYFEKNHSKKFYKIVIKYIPNYKKYIDRLSKK